MCDSTNDLSVVLERLKIFLRTGKTSITFIRVISMKVSEQRGGVTSLTDTEHRR